MLNKLIFIFLSTILFSCGMNNPISDMVFHDKNKGNNIPKYSNDVFFNEFKIAFEQDTGISAWSMPTSFSMSMESHHAGVCHMIDRSWVGLGVEINQDYWRFLSDTQKEVILFHEFFHCAGRFPDHVEGSIQLNGVTCPKSIMNKYVFNTWQAENCYKYNKSYYITELLSHR